MLNERLLLIAKERYDTEFTRRAHLVSVVAIYLAGLSLLIFDILNKYIGLCLGLSVMHFLLYAFTLLLITFMILILVNSYKFFGTTTYCYIPLPGVIKEYSKKLNIYFEENYEKFFKDIGTKDSLTDNKLCEKLLDWYTTCALENHSTNNLRAKRMHKIGRYLIVVIILFVINLIPYSFLIRTQ